MQADVIIVGSGLAGSVAALAAAAKGAKVILVDRGPIGLGSNTAMADGIFTNVSSRYNANAYVKDTINIGKDINEVSRVHAISTSVSSAFEFLESQGFEFISTSDVRVIKQHDASLMKGNYLARMLAKRVTQSKKIRILKGCYIRNLIEVDGRVDGVRGFDNQGNDVFVSSASVILATGGAGAIYQRNDNQKNIMGQGYRMAAMAGLGLWDMEFVQFYPLVFNEPSLPSILVYSPYPEGLRLVDGKGADLLKEAGLPGITEAIKFSRDELSRFLYQRIDRGIFLDFTGIDDRFWKQAPMKHYVKFLFNFKEKPVKVSPGAHFFMGGVKVDENGATSLPGLFACGELVWGLHGANRRGGNALTECVVSGLAAGNGASSLANQGFLPNREFPRDKQVSEIKNASSSLSELSRLRASLQNLSWLRAGIVRSDSDIRHGLDEARHIGNKLENILPVTPRERKLACDVSSALFVIRAILTASLARTESRGAFFREDYPNENNEAWRCNSCLVYDKDGDEFSLSHHPADRMC